jgi:hypothetical protein
MTTLPVDYRKRPWRAKYLDEETPVLSRWIVFGEFDDGTVGISDMNSDIFEHVPRDVAEQIIDARNAFVDVVLKHFSHL